MKTIDPTISAPADVIAATIEVFQKGGLVIFPTETVYGAGVDATNQAAVDKLLAYKSRREGKPMSIAVPNKEEAKKYVEINGQAAKLYERFLPGPMTVVSKSKGVVAEGVASEFGTLGVRIPDHAFLLELLKAYGKPITATSANGSGEKRPYTIQDIFDGLSEKQKSLIDLVLDAGRLPPNEPSTVIDTTLSTPTTLREGALTKNSSLQELVPHASTQISHSETETKQIAGTLLLKHWDKLKEKGLVIGLEGPLGAGKTIFTKGIAEFLKINETLTSPTYSYIEEYEYNRHGVEGKLYHLDMWKVDDDITAQRLEIGSLIAPHNVVVIEWWSQIKDLVLEIVTKNSIPFAAISIQEKDSTTREITVNES